jgi:hypothetical protein
METKYPDAPWPDPMFDENQKKFTWEMLQPYAGQYIVWSWDGSCILAAGPSREGLDEKVRAAGIDPSWVVFDYVEDPNEGMG